MKYHFSINFQLRIAAASTLSLLHYIALDRLSMENSFKRTRDDTQYRF